MPGGGRLTISTANADLDAGYVCDTGCGMDAGGATEASARRGTPLPCGGSHLRPGT